MPRGSPYILPCTNWWIFFPTVADYCGLKAPHPLAGRSLRPLLGTPSRPGKDAACTLITAETGDGIKEIQVLRDGQLEKTIPVGAKIADANWTAQKQRAGEFWYCRVIMDNGHIAWTSPIWLGCKPT